MNKFEEGLCAGLMLSGKGKSAKLIPIGISENGTYTPPTDYDGFSSVVVNVQATANIQPLTVVEPATYHAADYGCDGFDPVIVSDKYKKLYEYAVTGGSDNTTDDGQNVPNSLGSGDTENTNEYLDLSSGEFDTVTNSGNSLQITFYVEATPHPVQDKYWTLSYYWKVTNLSTGDTWTGRCFSTDFGWNEATTKKPIFKITNIEYGTAVTKIHYSMTRYWDMSSVRDTWTGRGDFDHNSYSAGTYTDNWFISVSQ